MGGIGPRQGGETGRGLSRKRHLYKGSRFRGLISDEIRDSSLLKWPDTLYRPGVVRTGSRGALRPCAFRFSLLGRSQAVRQRILIPPFGGSIPPAPASAQTTLDEAVDMACRMLGALVLAKAMPASSSLGRELLATATERCLKSARAFQDGGLRRAKIPPDSIRQVRLPRDVCSVPEKAKLPFVADR
jgi:hypothetical protein